MIITVQDKNLDFATEKAIDISEIIYNKYKLKYFKCECLSDGTSILMVKTASFRKYILFDILCVNKYNIVLPISLITFYDVVFRLFPIKN